MSDLTSLQATEAVRIVGSDASGVETNPVDATTDRELTIADRLNSGGLNGNLLLTTAGTAYELKVGASRKTNRKLVIFVPLGNNIYYGFSSSVTTSNGIPIFKNQSIMIPIGQVTEVWFVSSTSSVNVRIAEL